MFLLNFNLKIGIFLLNVLMQEILMGFPISNYFVGVIVGSTTESITGPYLYSHTRQVNDDANIKYETCLNKFTKILILGSLGGIVRVALAIFHSIGHGIAYIVTGKKGHKYHAIAGLCHLLRGIIETLPIIGQIFANLYGKRDERSWWMIKMYNPKKPDNFDIGLEQYSFYYSRVD